MESVPGLSAAVEAGVFRPVDRGADDLGARLEVGWILADNLRTFLGTRIDDDGRGLECSRAWLTDDRGGARPLVDTLELSEEGAAETGFPDCRTLLLFGPLHPETTRARLEVQRMEVAAGGLGVDGRCERLLDPWEGVDEDLALRVLRWERVKDPMKPVPIGRAEGCWGVEVDVSPAPAWEAALWVPLGGTLDLGTAAHRLIRLERGLTGWRLAWRAGARGSPRPELERSWIAGAQRRKQVREAASLAGFEPVVRAPGLSLALLAGEEVTPGEWVSGPWGPLADRFYAFFPPGPDPEAIRVDQVRGLPLQVPWVYEFHPKKMDDPRAEVEFPHEPFPFQAELWADGVYYDEAFMLLAPRMEVRPGPVAGAWTADCRVTDLQGEVYECVGQAWATLPLGGGQVHGLQFPPLHRLMERARLEITAVDVQLAHPLEVPCHA